MKRVWSDGTSAIEVSPLELTERLVALVPPARANQVLYKGVLAGNAAWRAEVVPKVASSTEAEREARLSLRLAKGVAKRGRAGDPPSGWAELLKRVFGVDGWACRDCGKRMKLRAMGIHPPASTTILRDLLRATGPPLPVAGRDDQGADAGA